MAGISPTLSTFKIKIEDAVSLVPSMMAEEKLKAVQFWNVISERLQEIVNNSAADISALAFELEKQNSVKPGEPQPQVDRLEDSSEVLLQGSQTLPSIPPPHLSPVPPSQPQPHDVSEPKLPDSRLAPPPASDGATNSRPTKIENNMDEGHHNPMVDADNLSPTKAEPYRQPMPNGRVLDDRSQPSPTALPLDCILNSESPASPSELRGLLMSDGFGSAVCKSESDQTIPDVRPKRSKVCGKWNAKVLAVDKTIQISEKNNKGDSSPRRQPPRSKRRQKNFALAAESDDSSDEVMAYSDCPKIEEGLATTEPGEEESKRIMVPTESADVAAECEEEENGTSGIILMNAKSLRGTAEGDDCFDDEEEESEEDGEDVSEESPIVNDDGHYVCFYCKKIFETLSAYASHKYVHTKPYSCTECLSRFSTKGNLIVHLRRHTGEKPFTCFQCHSKFSTKGNLKRHVSTHSGMRPWACAQCNGRFTEKKSLKVHMRRHTGEKPYSCTICNKKFAQTGILQTHMAMHMDQKEHLCEHCGKSFRQKSQLRLHMMRHEGIRKYQCSDCPSKFLTKGDLERHKRVHTGERPFICDLCGKTFTRQQSLNEHTNRHYGLKPYQCKYCAKGFAEMSACYKHIKQHERIPGVDEMSPPGSDTQQLTITCDSQKYTVLVQTDQALDVGSEISVVHNNDHQGSAAPRSDPEITVSVEESIGDFTAINLLANASSFQQTF